MEKKFREKFPARVKKIRGNLNVPRERFRLTKNSEYSWGEGELTIDDSHNTAVAQIGVMRCKKSFDKLHRVVIMIVNQTLRYG